MSLLFRVSVTVPTLGTSSVGTRTVNGTDVDPRLVLPEYVVSVIDPALDVALGIWLIQLRGTTHVVLVPTPVIECVAAPSVNLTVCVNDGLCLVIPTDTEFVPLAVTEYELAEVDDLRGIVGIDSVTLLDVGPPTPDVPVALREILNVLAAVGRVPSALWVFVTVQLPRVFVPEPDMDTVPERLVPAVLPLHPTPVKYVAEFVLMR